MSELPPAALTDPRVANSEGHVPSPATSLRWWPAVILLLMMVALRSIPLVVEAPPLPVMMLAFMGPAAVGLLLPLWWLFASRASLAEKLLGLVGLVVAAAISIPLAHFSMRGMTVALYQLPVGLAAFAVPLILLARNPSSRVTAALVAALVGFGGWDLLQLHGTTGRFAAEFGWRWSKSAEEQYLATLPTNPPQTVTADSAEATEILRDHAEWPEFRGRGRDGIVTGIRLADDWEQAPPRLVWKSRIGPGWSSFCVAGSRLFTQEQRGEDEAIVCLNAQTGESIWSRTYPARFWEAVAGAGPRATPTLGDNQLFALGAAGTLMAVHPATGTVLWERNLKVDAQREPPMWGWSSSPLLAHSLVIVHAGGPADLGVLAYHRDTGELAWSTASGDHSYSSPQFATFYGIEGLLVLTNNGLQFLNVDDGKVIWEHSYHADNYRALQPLVQGNNIYITTNLGEGTRKLSIERENDQWRISPEWTTRNMKPEFNDSVAYQGYMYGFDGNVFACIDLETGARKWKRGRYGNGQVLLLRDAGQLLLTSEQGELVLVKADPTGLAELAKIPAITGKTWNHPVLVGSHCYLRNGEEAACYELPLAAASTTTTQLAP